MTEPETAEAVDLAPGSAAPLVGSPNPTKLHVLSLYNIPSCMNPTRPPIYPVNFEMAIQKHKVPLSNRCSRRGCRENWRTPVR